MPAHFSLRTIAAVALLGLAACAEAPTSAPVMGPALSSVSTTKYTQTHTLSQTVTGESGGAQAASGDTVVTVFVVGTSSKQSASVNLGFQSRIDFPYQAGSICDPLRSSYGSGTWDSACPSLNRNITITAKTWLNAKGKLETDFQPALRFVPNLGSPVTLTLKDAARAGTRIDFCTPRGCIDESIADASLKTKLDRKNGFASRIIKHFSGYTITAD